MVRFLFCDYNHVNTMTRVIDKMSTKNSFPTRPEKMTHIAARAVAVVASALFLSGAASAQNAKPDPHGPNVGMATRSVSKYLDLERSLQQAIAEHDRVTVTGLLDPDFIERSAASDDPIALGDWLTETFKKPNPNGQVRDLLVIETDDVATVSFLLDTGRSKADKGRAHTYFIVDVWRQSTGKLQARYSDTPTSPPRAPDRPNGRE
jgi:hypothetical protein